MDIPVLLNLPKPGAEGSCFVCQDAARGWFRQLLTDIDRSTLESVLEKYSLKGFAAQLYQSSVEHLVQNWQQIEPGGLAAIFGSSNYLEMVVCEASAAHQLGASSGAQVMVSFHK